MGIMTRVLRLWKADMHGVMDQLEDKSLLLKQCLREMETSLELKQNRMRKLERICEQIRNDLSVREKERVRLENDLDLAVRKEKDDIAKLLIRKQFAHKADSERLAAQLKQHEEQSQRLAHLLNEQQSQYEQLKIKAAGYLRETEQPFGDADDAVWSSVSATRMPSDEEVELALLRYKETLGQGGAS